jgi:hypothetical protein
MKEVAFADDLIQILKQNNQRIPDELKEMK